MEQIPKSPGSQCASGYGRGRGDGRLPPHELKTFHDGFVASYIDAEQEEQQPY